MKYRVVLSRQAMKDREKLRAAGLLDKAKRLAELVAENPYQKPPPYEKLVGDLAGMYSRRINIKHRFVYTVDEERKLVHILSLWTHYEF